MAIVRVVPVITVLFACTAADTLCCIGNAARLVLLKLPADAPLAEAVTV